MFHLVQILLFAISIIAITQVSSDNIPSLSIKPESFIRIPENEQNGTCIGVLIAKHGDPDEVLTIQMVAGTDTNKLVKLSTQTGDAGTGVSVNITLATKELDRDFAPSTRQLYFKVRDRHNNQATIRADLFITDINDEKPTFVNLPYRFHVYENETIGKSLYSITSKDPDDGPGGVADYWLTDPSNLGNPFNLTGGVIVLSRKLNYSVSSFHQLKVHAMDKAPPYNKADPIDLIVNVLDVQNAPPYFINQPYTASIPENTDIGAVILTVFALDGDRGVPNDIKYSIVEVDGHNFTINTTSGEISVSGELDADDEEIKQRGGVFKLTINASEIIDAGQINYGGTWSTTVVSITLTDINDNIPTFTKHSYEATIAENSPKGVPLTMVTGELIEVYDLDQTPAHHSFELLIVEHEWMFDTIPATLTPIYSKSTVILKVNTTQMLDYETRTNITFTLIAKGLNSNDTSNTTIIVHIQDVNDNSPIFSENHQTEFEIYENVDQGTFIGSMNATDKESGVYYSLDDNDEKVFQIDSHTGNITVKGELDREMRSLYTVFVIATDINTDSNQQRSTRLRITIHILDVNDNPPEFDELPSRRQIPEDSKKGSELLTVRARDKDNGTNQEIIYSLIDNNNNITGFDIDENFGEITVNNSLIGMVGVRYITVMATDKGLPPLNTTAVILITVTDVNLNRPVFIQPPQAEYNVSSNLLPEVYVTEELPTNSHIYMFYANDSDSGDNGDVSYRLVPDSSNDWQNFFLDRRNGYLSNYRILDREKQEVYLISISAVDGGIPDLETLIKFKIILRDIDDNQPIFKDNVKQPHPLTVREEHKDVVVGNIYLATDEDSQPLICYYIIGGELVDSFYLNRTSGILSLVKALDRELLSEVHLVIQASGDCARTVQPSNATRTDFINGHPPDYDRNNNTLLWVRISVSDINDQPPVFTSAKLTSGFLYDIEFGTIIQELQEDVSDADIGINRETYFKLLGPITTKDMDFIVDAGDPPILLNVNGTIQTNMLFSSDMTGAFILHVLAYDIGNLTDEAEILIYLISDIQRVKMVFRKTPDEVRASKDAIIKELEKALKYRIVVDKIATHQASDGIPVTTKSDMFIHARYLDTDEVVPAAELWRAFDFSENVNIILDKYGVILTVPVAQQKKVSVSLEETLKKSLIIVTVSLASIAVVLIIVLINLRSRYRRRLRAANTKTFGSARDDIPDIIPPGTNQYFAAASNPVYMKEISLNLVEDSVSHNSLDDNEVGNKQKHGISFEPEEQEIVMSLYDERSHELVDTNRSPALDMVLQQYEEVLKSHEAITLTNVSIADLEQTDI